MSGKSHQDVRSYVRHISVIDNQRTLSQLSHRLEARRTWSAPVSAALPLPVNKLAVYEQKPSSAAAYAHTRAFPFFGWLCECVASFQCMDVDVQCSVCDLSYILPCTDQMFPLLSDCVYNSWTPYMVFWSLESQVSFKEFVLWELLETLLF